jgi:hypothetical protein
MFPTTDSHRSHRKHLTASHIKFSLWRSTIWPNPYRSSVSAFFLCTRFVCRILSVFVDFPNLELLVFKPTPNQPHGGHIRNTKCRPDFIAAFKSEWKTENATLWPCIRLVGEKASSPETPQGSGHMVTVAPTPTFAAMCAPACEPMPMPMPTAPEADGVWPVDTELIYVGGMTKIMLTAQCPVMWTVIQDAFENIHASLLFNCALPDASVIPSVMRDGLVAAAWSNMPRASSIHGRLLMDEVYVAKLSCLVSRFFTG